jgi:mannitol-1-phosphate/altronate dehydrogenase
MSEPSIIGSSRTAEVLDPTFLDGLPDLPTEEVRRRRDESLAEREFLSYLRRLLQVRQDVMAAERGQRTSGNEPEPLVDRLTAVLSKGGKANSTRGEAIRTVLSDADLEEAERQAETMLPPLNLNQADEMNDEEIERAVRSLAEAERAVSSRRAAVIRVHDRLQDELKQRYRDNPAEIPTGA